MPPITNPRIPPFPLEELQAMSRILGDTKGGLHGSEIGYLLRNTGIPEPKRATRKWMRLYDALVEYQAEHHVGNHVLIFVNRVMTPARYYGRHFVFRACRGRLNAILEPYGLSVGEDGTVGGFKAARTFIAAVHCASRLRAALAAENCHPEVLTLCTATILEQNYLHAFRLAMKGITARIRALSGQSGDGVDLVHAALGLKFGPPHLALNSLQTEADRREQRAVIRLLEILYGTIRHPSDRELKLQGDMGEVDLICNLMMVSTVHQKLDEAACRGDPRRG